jgi:hypothetical protein
LYVHEFGFWTRGCSGPVSLLEASLLQSTSSPTMSSILTGPVRQEQIEKKTEN